jgi:hypothetical protein
MPCIVGRRNICHAPSSSSSGASPTVGCPHLSILVDRTRPDRCSRSVRGDKATLGAVSVRNEETISGAISVGTEEALSGAVFIEDVISSAIESGRICKVKIGNKKCSEVCRYKYFLFRACLCTLWFCSMEWVSMKTGYDNYDVVNNQRTWCGARTLNESTHRTRTMDKVTFDF